VLKLTAQDTEDLKIISAHTQDALVRVSDIRYLSKTRQFALVANRFAWENQPNSERRRTGLHFEHVMNVKQHGILGLKGDAILSLLAISFEPGQAPSGTVVLAFSADCTIKLVVEYLDLQLKDLGGAWATEFTPHHGD
jgi:Flp pilus assembly CpaE family ATPase